MTHYSTLTLGTMVNCFSPLYGAISMRSCANLCPENLVPLSAWAHFILKPCLSYFSQALAITYLTLSFIGLFQLGLLCVPFHIYWNIYLLCALIHILDFIVHFWINIVLFRIFHYKVKDLSLIHI